MAKTKADWLKEAEAVGLKMTDKDKIADIKAAIESTAPKKHDKAAEAKAVEEKVTVAKAGKRSAKAIREVEEEDKRVEKAEKVKEEGAEADHAEKKGPIPVSRPLIDRRSKGYRNSVEGVDLQAKYEAKDALALAVKTSVVKFDATVELHVRLNVDPKQADQNIRETVILPQGTGKTLRIAVFAPADQHEAAKKAGADLVGEETIIEQLKKEVIDFDVLIATPMLMAQLGRYAKLLGPKGLMPNPKSGTVNKNVVEAVKAAKAGRVELRVDDQGIVHTGIGKVSFGADKLVENYEAAMLALKNAKPSTLKNTYIETITVSSSMGPGIKVKF